MTFGTTVGVPLAKKLLKQCYDAGVNLCGLPHFLATLALLLSGLLLVDLEMRMNHFN